MPELRNNTAICFVHGHGAGFSSDRASSEIAEDRKSTTPLGQALDRAKTRAATQLAIQRVAILRIEKK